MSSIDKIPDYPASNKGNMFLWRRKGNGYEVSTKGDKRFSALAAKLSEGRTIEQIYQCDIKGYDPGGTNWKLGKGKPPKNPDVDLWGEYLNLWRRWAIENPNLINELKQLAAVNNYTLTDTFAKSTTSQARALAIILNEINFPDDIW